MKARPRLLRFVRILVACLAFMLARPATASVSVDAITLVATAPITAIDESRVEDKVANRATTARLTLTPTPRLERQALRAPVTGSEHVVLVPEKYLRHCALLR